MHTGDPSIEVLLHRLPSKVNRVSTKKLADIQKQLPFVPLVYRSFYQDLIDIAARSDDENSKSESDVENSENETVQAVNDKTQWNEVQSPLRRTC